MKRSERRSKTVKFIALIWSDLVVGRNAGCGEIEEEDLEQTE